MARIRSTHPGQWTDDDFVTMSYPARLLAIGIRNEADDQGVFVWKPIQIKMKLFPADDVDVVALLGELIAARQVCRFEAGGRSFGAIRNFRRWQRPEKPKPGHGLPDNLREYVGLPPIDPGTDPEERPGEGDGGGDPPPTGPRPVPDRSPTDPGKSPQRKEEGGNGIDDDDAPAPARKPFDPATEAVIQASGSDPSKQAGWATASAHVAKWRQRFDFDLDVLPAIRGVMVNRAGRGPPDSPAYFDKAILEAHERRLRPLPELVNGGRTDGRTTRQNDIDARRSEQGDAFRRLAQQGG